MVDENNHSVAMRMNSTDWTRQWGKHLEILAFKSPQRIFCQDVGQWYAAGKTLKVSSFAERQSDGFKGRKSHFCLVLLHLQEKKQTRYPSYQGKWRILAGGVYSVWGAPSGLPGTSPAGAAVSFPFVKSCQILKNFTLCKMHTSEQWPLVIKIYDNFHHYIN